MTETQRFTQRSHDVNKLLLVPNTISQETIEALEFLLQEARSGELIGLAYVGMMKRRSCIMDTAGEAYRNPLFALGMVSMLSTEIANRARHEPLE